MKPLLKSNVVVDWNTTTEPKSSQFLAIITEFLEENGVKRRASVKKQQKSSKRRRKRESSKTSSKDKEKEPLSKSSKGDNQPNKQTHCHSVGVSSATTSNVAISSVAESSTEVQRIDGHAQERKKASNWPVVLGLRSVLRCMSQPDKLQVVLLDAEVLKPSAMSHFVGIFAASLSYPVYSIVGLSGQLSPIVHFPSVHAMALRKDTEALHCDRVISAAHTLLSPVIVSDHSPVKRRCASVHVHVPVPTKNTKKKSKKKKNKMI